MQGKWCVNSCVPCLTAATTLLWYAPDKNDESQVCELDDDSRPLGFYSPKNGMEIKIVDTVGDDAFGFGDMASHHFHVTQPTYPAGSALACQARMAGGYIQGGKI